MTESWYLSPTTAIKPKYRDCFGILETLGSGHDVSTWPVWALDNGRFTGAWTEPKWIAQLEFYENPTNALFAVVPDEPYDARETLRLFKHYAPIVRNYGYPVALATQDEMAPQVIPWDELDALFIGGSDAHKRGREGGSLITEARKRRLWIHVGRVNSGATILKHFWLANSWDGQTLAIKPGQQAASIARAVRTVRLMKKAVRLIDWD
jgi:hypothetical protein